MNIFKNKINYLYLFIIPVVYILFQMNTKLGGESVLFYGFAENKETELSHDKAVMVHKIYVTPGQEVNKGQLLMEVKQSSIDLKINDISHDLAQAELLALQQKQLLQSKIEQLQIKKQNKAATINAEIRKIKSEIEIKQSLLKDLKSIKPDGEKETSVLDIQLEWLRQKLEQETASIDLEIGQLNEQLNMVGKPSNVVRQKLEKEIDYYEAEQQKLFIYAPTDGLVGNIHCKEGENIDAFSTLISFYERNPTLVKGFVHESLILQVKTGDSLLVASSLHPSHQIIGVVLGLGSRIVEIPERLRKIPELKTYGREVLVQIPADNPFLQKEKVMLNSLDAAGDFSLTSILFPFGKMAKKEDGNTKKNYNLK
ncbi:MAG TPA: hypothetical protein ENJ95_13560 [Bacteroidetes bacterium]|nr:hypothetical protein [Bacteroidota bacterium]